MLQKYGKQLSLVLAAVLLFCACSSQQVQSSEEAFSAMPSVEMLTGPGQLLDSVYADMQTGYCYLEEGRLLYQGYDGSEAGLLADLNDLAGKVFCIGADENVFLVEVTSAAISPAAELPPCRLWRVGADGEGLHLLHIFTGKEWVADMSGVAWDGERLYLVKYTLDQQQAPVKASLIGVHGQNGEEQVLCEWPAEEENARYTLCGAAEGQLLIQKAQAPDKTRPWREQTGELVRTLLTVDPASGSCKSDLNDCTPAPGRLIHGGSLFWWDESVGELKETKIFTGEEVVLRKDTSAHTWQVTGYWDGRLLLSKAGEEKNTYAFDLESGELFLVPAEAGRVLLESSQFLLVEKGGEDPVIVPKAAYWDEAKTPPSLQET